MAFPAGALSRATSGIPSPLRRALSTPTSPSTSARSATSRRALSDAIGAGAAQAKLYEEFDPMGMYEVALQNGEQMPGLRIDGPYGAPAENVFENEIAVLIGTGIGVTPWASILKNIWHLRNSPNPPARLRRVEFIWVARDTGSFEWFQTLLSSLENQSKEAARLPGSSGVEFLKIHTYLTQKLDMDTTQNIVLNSVGAEIDPLTELQSRTQFERPDFKRLFTTMRDGILDRTYLDGLEGSMRTTVGVYFCGPSTAGKDSPCFAFPPYSSPGYTMRAAAKEKMH